MAIVRQWTLKHRSMVSGNGVVFVERSVEEPVASSEASAKPKTERRTKKKNKVIKPKEAQGDE